MTTPDLRKYIRFQLQGAAQLRLEGGRRVQCSVRDLSMGGAYVIREGRKWDSHTISPGSRVRLRVQEPTGPRFVLTAEVVRIEPNGGPGLALRFLITEHDIDPRAVADFVRSAGLRVGAPAEALVVPNLAIARRQGWRPAQRVLRVVTRIGTAALFTGGGYLLYTWLDARLF